MRKVLVIFLGLVVSIGVVAWKGPAAAPAGRGAAALTTIGNSSVAGNYSVLMMFHDTTNGQDGNGAGIYHFDGNGNLSGVLSENSRCVPTSTNNACNGGNAVNIRAGISGHYTVFPDASATLDICINIITSIGPQGGNLNNQNPESVEVMWEGSFDKFLTEGRFIQTLLRPITPAQCTPAAGPTDWVQTPNVTTGELEHV